jgi:glycerol kinase
VEHDANEIWASQRAVARSLMVKKCLQPTPAAQGAIQFVADESVTVGITNQRETTVLWDRATGQPVANAIVWQDRRTAPRCDALRRQGKAGLIQSKTGLVLDAYFSATKLQWLLDHVPGARARAERGELAFGTVDSWLIWNLTGGRARDGCQQRLAHPAVQYPHAAVGPSCWPVQHSAQRAARGGAVQRRAGHTDARLLGAALRIAGVAGDQQAATFGQACFAPGMAKNTYGTGCFMLMNTGNAAVPSRTSCCPPWAGSGRRRPPVAPCTAWRAVCSWPAPPCSGCAMACKIIQSAPRWRRWPRGARHRRRVSGAGLCRPGHAHWDGYARGTLVGMTRGTTRAHHRARRAGGHRAAVADVFDAMARDRALRCASCGWTAAPAATTC